MQCVCVCVCASLFRVSGAGESSRAKQVCLDTNALLSDNFLSASNPASAPLVIVGSGVLAAFLCIDVSRKQFLRGQTMIAVSCPTWSVANITARYAGGASSLVPAFIGTTVIVEGVRQPETVRRTSTSAETARVVSAVV